MLPYSTLAGDQARAARSWIRSYRAQIVSLLLPSQRCLSSDVLFRVVDRDEVDRLRKRFMKLDKVRLRHRVSDSAFEFHDLTLMISQDNSGTIERDEFLSLPQVSSNPLATR